MFTGVILHPQAKVWPRSAQAAARAPARRFRFNAGLRTAEFLHHLARNLAGARHLCLGTVRDEDGRAPLDQLGDAAERINVGPLPAASVTRLAAAGGRPYSAPTATLSR